MNGYVATFYTHLSAITSKRALDKVISGAALAPVPRKLSSSCGTCLIYEANEPLLNLLDEDVEGVYLVNGDGYIKLLERE
ncbi:MAG: DUF3343 domain-containing protein [Clostridia bacterium]|nr:DUF3343 domain-containing protein [Clostridia bacterium]